MDDFDGSRIEEDAAAAAGEFFAYAAAGEFFAYRAELKARLSPLEFAYYELGFRTATLAALRVISAPQMLLDNEENLQRQALAEVMRLRDQD